MTGCKVCVHKQRVLIESQILARTPYLLISQHFSVSAAGLSRHRRHMGEPGTMTARPERGNEKLQKSAESLLRASLRVLKVATDKGDLRASAAAINNTARVLALVAKLSGTHAIPNRTVQPAEPEEDPNEVELALLLCRETRNFDQKEIARLRQIAEANDLPLLPPRPTE